MCFSASVSFGASLALGTLGLASFRRTNSKSLRFFALTPIFFGVQQFIEGCLWLSLQYPTHSISQYWTPFLSKGFLFFAWVIWPAFIPFFTYNLETNEKRKSYLKYLIWIGTFVSISLFSILLVIDIEATIKGRHILYERFTPLPGIFFISIFYVIALLAPLYISTTRNFLVLGLINLVSFVIAKWIFAAYFISVWCFFAAISSTYVYYLINQLAPYYHDFANKRKHNLIMKQKHSH